MKVIDPGHVYDLRSLDGEQLNRLVFVKREGPSYPGNVGHYPGTTMQEVLRALIDRANYVQAQIPCTETHRVIALMSEADTTALLGLPQPKLSTTPPATSAVTSAAPAPATKTPPLTTRPLPA